MRTTISLPDTESTCWATLARPTATGSSKPWPKIVTCWPPVDGPSPGPIEVMTTSLPYLKAELAIVARPVLMFLTSTSDSSLGTGWPEEPSASVRGDITTTRVRVTERICASWPLTSLLPTLVAELDLDRRLEAVAVDHDLRAALVRAGRRRQREDGRLQDAAAATVGVGEAGGQRVAGHALFVVVDRHADGHRLGLTGIEPPASSGGVSTRDPSGGSRRARSPRRRRR